MKYAVKDSAAMRAWLEHGGLDIEPGLEFGPWRTRLVEDRYIDTPDGALARAGFAARLRRSGRAVTLTLKSLASRASAAPASLALHDRSELEGPATSALDPSRWPPSKARALLEECAAGAHLQTRFVLRQRRLERDVEAEQDARAVLTLDAVEVYRRGERVGGFSELEVESADRRSELLARIAARIEASGLGSAERRSKEQTARDLISERPRGRPCDPRGVRAEVHREPRVSVARQQD